MEAEEWEEKRVDWKVLQPCKWTALIVCYCPLRCLPDQVMPVQLCACKHFEKNGEVLMQTQKDAKITATAKMPGML